MGVISEHDWQQVVGRARRGDEASAAAIFRDVQPRLLRFLRARDRRAAEDLAAEVWVDIAAGLRRFEGDLAGFHAWVFTIAYRRLADHRRHAYRRPTEVNDGNALDRAPSSSTPADAALERVSAQDAVDLISRMLPEDQADVVILRVLGDLDAAEVGRIMGRSAGWVRVVQHRALRRLAEHLGTKLGVTL